MLGVQPREPHTGVPWEKHTLAFTAAPSPKLGTSCSRAVKWESGMNVRTRQELTGRGHAIGPTAMRLERQDTLQWWPLEQRGDAGHAVKMHRADTDNLCTYQGVYWKEERMYSKVNISTELTGCECSLTQESWLHLLQRKQHPTCILFIKTKWKVLEKLTLYEM